MKHLIDKIINRVPEDSSNMFCITGTFRKQVKYAKNHNQFKSD